MRPNAVPWRGDRLSGWSRRDVTPELRGDDFRRARRNTAITEPTELAVLLRAVHAYNGHIAAVAALKRTSLVFMHPGSLRAAERR